MTTLRRDEDPRKVGDTEQGREIDSIIDLLPQLIEAYRAGQFLSRTQP